MKNFSKYYLKKNLLYYLDDNDYYIYDDYIYDDDDYYENTLNDFYDMEYIKMIYDEEIKRYKYLKILKI